MTTLTLRLVMGFMYACVVFSYSLEMNCTERNIVGSECMNYMREFISNYILVEKKYNPQTLPVLQPYWHITPPGPGVKYDPVTVKVQLTLKNLVEVATSSGSMTVAVYLDIYWRDQLLNWDPQWTDGYDFFDIDYTLLWRPDMQLYNVVGSYNDQMNVPALFLSSDGNAWWDAQGLITFSCDYDTARFPFDSQTCSATYGSWIYASYQMNISEAVVSVDSSFTNLAWNVTQVSASTSENIQWKVYPYSFATYTIQVRRYYTHYVATAIVPSLLVTYLTLLSLWIKDVNTRLSMGITGLLALVAVQWTVSSELPVSNKETWLGQVSIVCVCYTTVVCLQGFVVGYLESMHAACKEGKAGDDNSGGDGKGRHVHLPRWVLLIIALSVRHQQLSDAFARLSFASARKCGLLRAEHHANHTNQGPGRAEHTRDVLDVEGQGGLSLSPLAQQHVQGPAAAHTASGIGIGTGTGSGSDSGEDFNVNSASSRELTAGAEGGRHWPDHCRASSNSSLYQRDSAGRHSWLSGAAAFDHIARVWLPLTYTVILFAYFVDAAVSG